MSTMWSRRATRARLFGALTLVVAACSTTGPGRLDVGGTWEGTATLPDAHPTTFTVIQSGTTISGNVTIESLLDATFVGTFHENSRTVAWAAAEGCEQWSGTFTVSSDGSDMTGPVLGDRSGCAPAGTDLTGTISLSKQ